MAIINGKSIVLEGKEANRLYNKGAYGIFKGKKLILNLIEACYLFEKGRIRIDGISDLKELIEYAVKKEKDFEIKYLVYRDLRERGYILQPDKHFHLYERGHRPPAPPAYVVVPLSERAIFGIQQLAEWLSTTDKKLIIGIVDEEGDLTYYFAKFFEMEGKIKHNGYNGVVHLLKDRSMVWDANLINKLKVDYIGKEFGKFLQLSLMETAFIAKHGAKIIKDGNEMEFDDFMKYACKIQPDIKERLRVYEDLRNKGLLPKTGFKFGSHFRVYDEKPFETHAPYLIHVVGEKYKCSWAEVSRAVRLAHSVKKEMVFAMVGNDIKYIRLKRITP